MIPKRLMAVVAALALGSGCMSPPAKLAVGGLLAVPATILMVQGATHESTALFDLRGAGEVATGGVLGVIGGVLLLAGGLQLHEQHVNEERAAKLTSLPPPPGAAHDAPLPPEAQREILMRLHARLGHCDAAAAIARQLDGPKVVEALGEDAALRACVPGR